MHVKAAGQLIAILGAQVGLILFPLVQTEEDQVRWQRTHLLPVRCLEIPMYLAANEGQGGVK